MAPHRSASPCSETRARQQQVTSREERMNTLAALEHDSLTRPRSTSTARRCQQPRHANTKHTELREPAMQKTEPKSTMIEEATMMEQKRYNQTRTGHGDRVAFSHCHRADPNAAAQRLHAP